MSIKYLKPKLLLEGLDKFTVLKIILSHSLIEHRKK